MGAFVCTLSEEDWQITRELGIYGNRYFKEGTKNPFNKSTQLSIIRDLIAMQEGDYVFFIYEKEKQSMEFIELEKLPILIIRQKYGAMMQSYFPTDFYLNPIQIINTSLIMTQI
jgi:hypothetical protein